MNGALDTLKVPDPAMFDDYDVGGWTPPPQAKRLGPTGKPEFIEYRLTTPSADKFEFKADRNGFWMAVVDGFEVEGANYTLRKEYLSSAPFPKKDKAGNVTGTRNASTAGNYFRAHGLAVRPATAQEYESFALATAGRQFSATLDWSAYDSDRGVEVASKWEQFPDDPDNPGQKLAYIEQGDKRFWARAGVKRYVDQIGA